MLSEEKRSNIEFYKKRIKEHQKKIKEYEEMLNLSKLKIDEKANSPEAFVTISRIQLAGLIIKIDINLLKRKINSFKENILYLKNNT